MNTNLGIYINNLADTNQLQAVSETVNECIDKNIVEDCSIFFDNIAYNPFKTKCGIFNSTDIWNFSGKLITTSLSSTLTALKIVNKIDIYYYYGWENKVNVLALMNLLTQKVQPFAKSEKDQLDMYRKTGLKPILCHDFMSIVNRIG